nr:hypothetical protein [Tanacetum cinerariifolium]
DDASISRSYVSIWLDCSEKDSPGTEVDWQDVLFHETEDLFDGLDQAIQVMEMANDKVRELSNQEVADEQVKERRPSKRIRVTQKEMVKDEKPKKG